MVIKQGGCLEPEPVKFWSARSSKINVFFPSSFYTYIHMYKYNRGSKSTSSDVVTGDGIVAIYLALVLKDVSRLFALLSRNFSILSYMYCRKSKVIF